MDPLTLVPLARTLVDIDSTTGRETDCGRWLAAYLRACGYRVQEQPVADGRFNVLATIDNPVVVFSTHFDCVPPFITSRVDGDRLFGRGACDAKGILATQVTAAARLRQQGVRGVGLLFVVGEERGSDGAKAANLLPNTCRFLINGEPTDNRLGVATRGALRVKLTAKGRAAHSAYPNLGVSAIDKLIDALLRLRTFELSDDPVLGRTHYTIGLISGGIAPNVIPPLAEAEVMFRTVGPAADLLAIVERLADLVEASVVLEVPSVALKTVPALEKAVFPFTTDIPFLHHWGEPLLLGSGSILVAHTEHEYVSIGELERSVELYTTLATTLIQEAGGQASQG
jgi:acetylornithine deacetylase